MAPTMTRLSKLSLALTALITIPFFNPNLTKAQSSDLQSQTSTASDQIDPDTVKANIKERIKQAVDNNSPAPIAISSTPKGWIGIIEVITGQTISLSNSLSVRQAAITDDTTIVVDNTTGELEDLEIGTALITMGTIDDNEIMTTKRVVTIDSLPTKSSKQSLLITIDKIDLNTNQLSVTPLGQENPFSISLNKSSRLTEFADQDQELDLLDLNPSDQALLIFQPNEDDPTTSTIISLLRTQASN